MPLYYSGVHAAGSPSDGPSPASGAIIEHPKLKARITLDPPSPDLTEILHTLSESGITKNVLISLLMSVPEKSLCDSLVEYVMSGEASACSLISSGDLLQTVLPRNRVRTAYRLAALILNSVS